MNNISGRWDLIVFEKIQGHRASSIPLEEKVLVTLHFYATGSYQETVGDNKSFALSQSSVSRCVNDITLALNSPEIFSRFVKFPKNINELNASRRRFAEIGKINT
ncbi:hypothetical protein JTB14_005375 [Gonioctena quinquepunctata]|nr:hypothetical protein JTB14_005375 [Gonioctena quinquepunctata]